MFSTDSLSGTETVVYVHILYVQLFIEWVGYLHSGLWLPGSSSVHDNIKPLPPIAFAELINLAHHHQHHRHYYHHPSQQQIDFHLFKQMSSLNINPQADFWLYGRHLENSIWHHNSAADWPISKPKIQSQYGGRPFSQIGSSFISAVYWDIFLKVGLKIDSWLLTHVSLIKIA